MRIIPVLDVKDGLAVCAVRGDREHYAPLASALHPSPDPRGLARAFRDRLGLNELYLAELDAIMGRGAPDLGLIGDLASTGSRVWVDAGVRDRDDVPRLLHAGASAVIVGLETIAGPEELARCVALAGPDRLVLSLDLRDGAPITRPGAAWDTNDSVAMVDRAIGSGLTRLIVLDLARVGTGSGPGTLPLLRSLRSRFAYIEIIAGGGVRAQSDLGPLIEAGVDGVLMGSALHALPDPNGDTITQSIMTAEKQAANQNCESS
jgi:phosphoribosylformimino-5-aminoimidazole carboxamide ribotide isomerase